MRVSPNIIRQCWPARHDDVPVQNLDGVRQNIVHKLDESATRLTSNIVWDQFMFPQVDPDCWRQEMPCYHPGKILDVGT